MKTQVGMLATFRTAATHDAGHQKIQKRVRTTCGSRCQSYSDVHHFMYARLDLYTGRKLVIIAGTHLKSQHQLLANQFSGDSANLHLFSILLTLTTMWAHGVDPIREDLDIGIQDLEADTGHSSLKNCAVEPLPPEKLGIRRNLTQTRSFLEHPARASQHLCGIFDFLSEEVLEFDKLQEQGRVLSRPSQLSRQLRAMFLQRKSQSEAHVRQTKYLIFRVEAQWNITNALVAQHNNTLNYSTARAARSDNGFIRRISFVTLTFLPATFLATFFSMTFFHTEQGHLSVSPQIWVYVVCAIPITFFMAWEFGLRDVLIRKLDQACGLIRRSRRTPQVIVLDQAGQPQASVEELSALSSV